MPVVRMPNGDLVNFPDNMPKDDISNFIVDKFPDAYAPKPGVPLPDTDTSFFRSVADVPLKAVEGTLMGTRMISDAFGADNVVSQALEGAEEQVGSLMSAQSKRDQQEIARIMAEAEDKGAGAQISAGLTAFKEAPIDFAMSALGTSVPMLAAGVAAYAVGAPAAIASGVGVLAAAIQGAGVTKDAVHDAVYESYVEAGVSPEEAEKVASEAQS